MQNYLTFFLIFLLKWSPLHVTKDTIYSDYDSDFFLKFTQSRLKYSYNSLVQRIGTTRLSLLKIEIYSTVF